MLFIPPSSNIDVGIDDDPIIKEVGEEDDEPSVVVAEELFDVGKFIIVGEYVGDVFSFIAGDRELEEPPRVELPVVLEVGGDDSPPILFVEFVKIAVEIIDGESDESKPSCGDIDGAVVLLDVAEDDVPIVGGNVGDENVCVVDVVAEEGIAV